MRLALKHAVAAIILVFGFATPVVAGPLEDANAAIKRRDYATALRLIRPLAERGDANAQYNLGFFTTMVWVSRRTRSAHRCGSTCRRTSSREEGKSLWWRRTQPARPTWHKSPIWKNKKNGDNGNAADGLKHCQRDCPGGHMADGLGRPDGDWKRGQKNGRTQAGAHIRAPPHDQQAHRQKGKNDWNFHAEAVEHVKLRRKPESGQGGQFRWSDRLILAGRMRANVHLRV